MGKLPRGLKREIGHKYILLRSLKKADKVIARPGYIAISRGLKKDFFVCFVDQILKDIYPDGQSEIEIWGNWINYKDRESWGKSTHCFWSKEDWNNDVFFIKP